MSLPAGAVDLRPAAPRAQRLQVSHLERAMAGTTHAWAMRAVLMARLEHAGQREAPRHDVWLVKS